MFLRQVKLLYKYLLSFHPFMSAKYLSIMLYHIWFPFWCCWTVMSIKLLVTDCLHHEMFAFFSFLFVTWLKSLHFDFSFPILQLFLLMLYLFPWQSVLVICGLNVTLSLLSTVWSSTLVDCNRAAHRILQSISSDHTFHFGKDNTEQYCLSCSAYVTCKSTVWNLTQIQYKEFGWCV